MLIAVHGRLLSVFGPLGRAFLRSCVLHRARSTLWMLQKSLLREPAEGITRRAASRTPPSLADVAVVEETLRAALGPDLELNVNLAPEIQIEPDVKFHGSHRLVRNAYEMTGAR